MIESVGENLAPPADARVWQAQGKTLYPGLIDAYSELSAEVSRSALKDGAGATYWNPNVTPQVRAGLVYAADAAANRKLRSQGITAPCLFRHPRDLAGQDAVADGFFDDAQRRQ